MKKLIIFCSVILTLATVIPIIPTASDREIYQKTVRLHVLAASDGEDDQELKLEVRDAVLDTLSPILEDVNKRDTAVELICEHEKDLKNAALEVIKERGRDDDISLSFSEEYYPRREYEGVTLPAGTYLSLRVMIGKAQGKNWWCVLFPTLCTSSAEPKEKLAQAGFTTGQIKLITDTDSTRYKLKFKLLELFEEWF